VYGFVLWCMWNQLLEVRSVVCACHEAATSSLLPSRGKSNLLILCGKWSEGEQNDKRKLLGSKVRADTNINYLILTATLSPAILIPCCPSSIQS
jgi:hypothetical protein